MIEHYYLWNWQQENEESEGRRKRPSCVVLIVVDERCQHGLFIAPITSSPPKPDRVAIAVPETEAPRARLDTCIPLWFMVDELNIDGLEASYTLETREPRGQFGPAFTNVILRAVKSVRQGGKLKASDRS